MSMLPRVRSNLTIEDLWGAGVMGVVDPIKRLEETFAARFGFPHALLFPYGRSALHSLLLALEWRDREILCPAYTCAEVPYAISCSGSRIRFVDSAPDHFLPGETEWSAAASASSAMAVITPLFGYPVGGQCEAVVRRAAPDAFILFDESHAYGIRDTDGLQARNTDGVLFSLGLGKMLTALSGGVLLLRDRHTCSAVKKLRDARYAASGLLHDMKLVAKGIAAWLAFREPAVSILDLLGRRLGVLPVQAQDWTPSEEPTLPSDSETLMSAYQARIGLLQFARLDTVVASRQRNGQYYDRRLLEEGFRTFPHAATPTWPRYPWPVADRDAAAKGLHGRGIQVSFFLPYSCADLPAYHEQSDACPNAAFWGRSMINLPNWPGLEIAQAERVISALVRLREQDPKSLAWPGRA
jgi:dTDP-4-amino-4,6-dideoxygalactose transaminase